MHFETSVGKSLEKLIELFYQIVDIPTAELPEELQEPFY
ncbi:MAG: hypothetical protein CM15mP49_25630 [Actinomycetota bacterium]|nr:MAG: hypothetical protein CM15mP49_25630 [Actinomycetota bacterium]